MVFEEVREDHAILPIFEEKIIGKVEKIDWVRRTKTRVFLIGASKQLDGREKVFLEWEVQESGNNGTDENELVVVRSGY